MKKVVLFSISTIFWSEIGGLIFFVSCLVVPTNFIGFRIENQIWMSWSNNKKQSKAPWGKSGFGLGNYRNIETDISNEDSKY